jgi:hypothetical protein
MAVNVVRKYVGVMAEFMSDGRMLPREVIWDDGRKFIIEKVVSAKKAAELRSGGVGLRYDCMINGQEKRIYYDERKWFVECGS